MSTAPQGWQNPKTNWQGADVVLPSDMNRIEANAQAIETGSRTLDDTQVPTSNTGNLRQLLDWFANRIRAITGMSNWWQAPPYTLNGATSAPTANRLVARDSNGRAQFANPQADQDAATKGYVDTYVKSRVQTSAYTGNGQTNRTISVGFRPKVVTIYSQAQYNPLRLWCQRIDGAPFANWFARRLAEGGAYDIEWEASSSLVITDTGFQVSGELNTSGRDYYWVAIG